MNEQLKGKLYTEENWFRCWINKFRDGGWVVGELDYTDGTYYVVNSDNNGQLLIKEEEITEWN